MQKIRKQDLGDGLGLGLGAGLKLGLGPPGLGLPGTVVGGALGGTEPPPPAGLLRDAVGEAERLGERDGDGRLTREMPVPSDELADAAPSGEDETTGRMVVAAPLVSVGPLLSSSVYPATLSPPAISAETISVRRRLRRVRFAAGRSRRREAREEGCPGAPGGAGSHTALIAGP